MCVEGGDVMKNVYLVSVPGLENPWNFLGDVSIFCS